MLTTIIGILGSVLTKVILTLAFAITAWLIAKVIMATVNFIRKISARALVIYRNIRAQRMLKRFKGALDAAMKDSDEADEIRRALNDMDNMIADGKCGIGIPVENNGERSFSKLNFIECANETAGDMVDDVIMINDNGCCMQLQRN